MSDLLLIAVDSSAERKQSNKTLCVSNKNVYCDYNIVLLFVLILNGKNGHLLCLQKMLTIKVAK